MYKLPKIYDLLHEENTDEKSTNLYKMLSKFNLEKGYFLDLGCGTGKILNSITKEASGIGIDISKDMILFANNNYKKKNIKFLCKSFTEIEYKNRFNFVYSTNDCLNYLKPTRWKFLFSKINKSLLKNSFFYFDFTTYSDFHDIWPNHYEIIEKKKIFCIKNHSYNKW